MKQKLSKQIVQAKKDALLAALAKTGNISGACRATKTPRNTHYNWLEEDEGYAVASARAIREAGEALEAEAWRRAVRGVKKPVYQQGDLVGHIQQYSDVLLIFLMKGAMPEKYRERSDVTISGPPVKQYVGFDPDEV